MPNSISQPSVPLSSKLSEVTSVSTCLASWSINWAKTRIYCKNPRLYFCTWRHAFGWWCWWRHYDPDIGRCCGEINATFYDQVHITSLIGTNFELVPMLSNFYGQRQTLFALKRWLKCRQVMMQIVTKLSHNDINNDVIVMWEPNLHAFVFYWGRALDSYYV